MESITSNSQTEQTFDSSQLARRRKIFGTCKGCSQPNTNFNECDACETWVKQQQTKLLELQNDINDRKNRINQQICSNCDQPKHVHHHIAACGECGYPEIKIEDLYEFAICKDDDDNDEEEDGCGIKISDLSCPRCDSRLQGFLQCPDYTEVVERIRLELNEMKYDDPDYRKLVEVKERYDNLVQQQQDEEDQWVTDEDEDDELDDYNQIYYGKSFIESNTSIDRNIKMSQIGLNSLLRSSAMKVQF
ncbi:hypothetical protein C2G38_2222881 [Gigaspora rosea]|uniref:Uncharacterized protein n=1 Tax=Gigaspora rosea TaxID=44941 RepID=A0A397UAC6_9GLOM|nr:hypothetical protein C2G38_2222881 [Gigaspora rosea]